MCEPQSPPLAMSHSPAYHPHYRASQSSSPAFRQQPPPRRPPPAHVEGQPVRSLSDVKASISSATSGSTDATEADRHSRQSQLSSAASHRLSNSNNGHREMVQAPPATVIRYIQYDVDEEEEGEEPGHAIWILFWMSCLDPLFSLFSCLLTIFTLIALVAVSPIRLCKTEWSFSLTLIRTICPVYRKHLRLLCAPSVDNAHNFEFSTTRLILIHVVAPALSVCFAFFLWIAAVFWLFAITMGNPDGNEKRDDGRATVLMARNKWEKFLLLALRRQ